MKHSQVINFNRPRDVIAPMSAESNHVKNSRVELQCRLCSDLHEVKQGITVIFELIVQNCTIQMNLFD